jgi:RimJ/RimL family protein N-acetyltransferase
MSSKTAHNGLDHSILISTSDFHLEARLVSWDSEVFGIPVAQIEKLAITSSFTNTEAFLEFEAWVERNAIGIVSCRLDHTKLRESMFLENRGFRFVEMVLHPTLDRLGARSFPGDSPLIAPAEKVDLPELRVIAETAFSHERYHVDPRLNSRLANLRYGNWLESSFHHPRQVLLKISATDQLVGFFIVETLADASAYWHLTAIAPALQGQGYGLRAWQAMLARHKNEGITSVSTTISARNTAVLNLYAKLGFRFLPPEMTFHWIRSAA